MSEERIEELYEQSYQLEGPERVALFEEMIRLADSMNNEEFGYGLRMELVEEANQVGMHDRAMVAFSWCLTRHDKMEDPIDTETLLWYFKWILQEITRFSGVARDQIAAMEDDMQRRLETNGFNRRPIEYIRCLNRVRMGDLKAAQEHYPLWQSAKRDGMADCKACELDNEVEYLAALGENEKAIEFGVPLLTGKKRGCAEVPHYTFGHTVRPFLRLNRLEEAETHYIKALTKIGGEPKFLRGVAEQILVPLRAGDPSKAVRLIDMHLKIAAASVDDDARCRFLKVVGLALELLASESAKRIKLRVPTTMACHADGDSYDPAELAVWFHAEATQLAKAFDSRNGNGYYSSLLEESVALVKA